MSKRLVLLLIPLLCASVAEAKRESADHAYEAARRGYYALKSDPARRKLRHHWLNVADRFADVAKEHPKSARAPDALFTAGELLNELSRISQVDEDLKGALRAYEKLVEAHPRHRLADDAALALARIQLERLEQPESARRTITEALKHTPRGDQARELRSLLASMPAPVRPVPARREKAVAEAKPEPRHEARPEPKAAAHAESRSAAAPESKPAATETRHVAEAKPAAAEPKPAAEPKLAAASEEPEVEVSPVADARAGSGVIEAIGRLSRDPALSPPARKAPAPTQPAVVQAKAAEAPRALDGAAARARLK
ncbi:MAG TPA: N-acetylmuramoyl-L-alanine amidase, partial [Aggregicoccus sp.]|nr:N-acetylmuramoyl-L-alanine amidase [Aggregicoccus sp.]